jgi:hypothetical protein
MIGDRGFCSGRTVARLLLAISLSAIAPLMIAVAARRIQIRPQFKPGETLYYQIEMHTISTGKTTTPIIDPEGGTKFSENVDLLIRLDVLANRAASDRAKRPPTADAEGVRIRVTYERAHAESQADAPAFNAPSEGREYNRLAGHSFEFTLESSGAITDFRDIDNIFPKSADAARALSWMKMLASGSEYPEHGIAVGQRWTSEKPLASAPLAGLVWRSESTYLRADQCHWSRAETKKGATSADQQCAVILTRFEIRRHRSSRADETPPDYLRHGLRTRGTLTGTGESLDSISLATGVLESSTQSSTQRSDFDIINAANGEKIHRVGQVQTQTVITRVSAPQAAANAQH